VRVLIAPVPSRPPVVRAHARRSSFAVYVLASMCLCCFYHYRTALQLKKTKTHPPLRFFFGSIRVCVCVRSSHRFHSYGRLLPPGASREQTAMADCVSPPPALVVAAPPAVSQRLRLHRVQSVPESFRQPFIQSGYRRGLTPAECARSAFHWHNETLNVWTDVVTSAYLLWLVARELRSPSFRPLGLGILSSAANMSADRLLPRHRRDHSDCRCGRLCTRSPRPVSRCAKRCQPLRTCSRADAQRGTAIGLRWTFRV
jgi:hypothetical protein